MMATSLPTDERERRQTAMESLRQDASYTLHSFARTPGFLAVVVLTLGFGIGASPRPSFRSERVRRIHRRRPPRRQRAGRPADDEK